MNKEQRDKAALNLEKFDGRIREQFRRFFNMIDFMGVVSDKEGGWGAINYSKEKSGTEAMGYGTGGKWTPESGKPRPKDHDYSSELESILGGPIDFSSSSLISQNQTGGAQSVIDSIAKRTSYEKMGGGDPLIVPVPIPTPEGEPEIKQKIVPVPMGNIASSDGSGWDILYKGS